MSEEVRRSWACGYMPREEWTFPLALPKPFHAGECAGKYALGTADDPICLEVPVRNGSDEAEVPCCPGYLVGLQAVKEAALAGLAFENGALPLYFPRLENAVMQAAALVTQAKNQYSAAQFKKLEREREGGRHGQGG